MPYVLGIDVGSTRTAAAVCRRAGATWSDPEVVPLEGGARWVESVLHVSRDASVLVGQAARRRTIADPERIARGFLRRVGDEVPFMLGEELYAAEVLTAALAGWVTDRVAEVESGPAEHIVMTHPPGWGPHRRGVLLQALHEAGLPGVLLLPSPIAAAESHLAGEPLDVGAVLAICRLGGQHVESAVLRRAPVGFELVAHAGGAEPLAGAHLDDLLVGHVLGQLGRDRIDHADPAVRAAMAQLRAECTGAKERLSVATDVTIPVSLPGAAPGVHVTRPEFERLSRPVLAAAVEALHGSASAVPAEQLTAAVLVGGSARIPLVTDLAAAALSCRVTVDADPGTAICRGAALAGRPRIAPEPSRAPSTTLTTEHDLAAGDHDDRPLDTPPPRPPVEITPLEAPKRFPRSRRANRPRVTADRPGRARLDEETERDEDGR